MASQRPVCPSIEIEYQDVDGARRLVLVDHAVVVGRFDDCDIQIRHDLASRWHLRIFPEGDVWWVADLDSRNGTLIDGRRVLRRRLEGPVNIQLGPQGASISVRPVTARGDSSGDTGAVDRQPPASIHSRIRWRLILMLGAIPLVIALAILIVPLLGPDRLDRDANRIRQHFYDIKTLEMELAAAERQVKPAASAEWMIRMRELRLRLEAGRDEHARLSAGFGARTQADLAPDERLLRRVVENWGDNPLTIPPAVIADIRRRIRTWQATEDLDRAMRRLNEGGFMPDIHRILTEARLAPQFLYLALVESGFRADAAVSRPDGTVARGLWSLTSEQAQRHGLRLGARPDAGTYDAEDERHQVDRATWAAAERLAAFYRIEAQGSGLLTLALYLDDGDDLGARLRALPETPEARDFWRLVTDGVLPEAILERVWVIVAAATIGENPRLFGFLFDNPLNGIATGKRRPPPHRELLQMLARWR